MGYAPPRFAFSCEGTATDRPLTERFLQRLVVQRGTMRVLTRSTLVRGLHVRKRVQAAEIGGLSCVPIFELRTGI